MSKEVTDDERAALVYRLRHNPILNVQSGRDNMAAADLIEADGKLIARVPEEVHAERARQVKAEGYSAEHDRGHEAELLRAAACYMEAARLADAGAGLYEWQHKPPLGWPWRREFWKPASARRMRVKAGALMLAAQDAWKADYDAAKEAL